MLALTQSLTGQSLGLHLLGEKYLDLTTPGVAKTTFGEWQMLRGYGLFAHPLILGIFGLLGTRFFPPCRVRKMSFTLALLAQSRAIWLSLLGYLRPRWWLLLFPLLTGLFLLRLPTSDSYRFQDLAHYVRYVEDNPQDLLFGTGAGQYAHRLQIYSDLVSFQYQPVHSMPLLLLVEMGLLPLGGLVLHRLWRKYQNLLAWFDK